MEVHRTKESMRSGEIRGYVTNEAEYLKLRGNKSLSSMLKTGLTVKGSPRYLTQFKRKIRPVHNL